MSTNQKGILIALVAIISLIQNTQHYYDLYVIVDDSSNSAFQKIKDLESRTNRITIKLIDSPRNFDFIKKMDFFYPPSSFYRLDLQNILPNLDKIIYIDIDCLVFDDLDEMYNFNMTNINLRGVLDPFPSLNDHIFHHEKYICCGVLLMNLKRMRETKIIDKYINYIKKNATLINKGDQTVVNNVDWQFNDVLPIKYGVLFCHLNESEYFGNLRQKLYSQNEIRDALYYPIIAHLGLKPFRHICTENICGMWWYYSRLTFLPAQYRRKFPIYQNYKSVLSKYSKDGLNKSFKSEKKN